MKKEKNDNEIRPCYYDSAVIILARLESVNIDFFDRSYILSLLFDVPKETVLNDLLVAGGFLRGKNV